MALEHVVAGLGQFVGHRLLGDQDMALGLALLVEPLDLRAPDGGVMRRLHEGPGEVLVAVALVAPALELAVAESFRVHATGIRDVVAWAGKPIYGAGLQKINGVRLD